MDINITCIKDKNGKCICDEQRLPLSKGYTKAVKERIRKRRLNFFLLLLQLLKTAYGITFVGITIMGAVAQRALTDGNGDLITALQGIVGGIPVFTTFHTSPLFRLHKPDGRLEGLARSQAFYDLIRHLQSGSPPATPVPEEAARATAQASYNRLISTGFLAGRGFYHTPWDKARALTLGPRVPTVEGRPECAAYKHRAVTWYDFMANVRKQCPLMSHSN